MEEEIVIKNIKFQDTTLRDGEQTPGIAYSLQDKIVMIDMLCKLNLNSIELGFPAASKEEAEIVKEIAIRNAGLNNIFCVFARAIESDIDIAYESIKEANCQRIQIVAPASDLHIIHSTRKDKASLLKDVEIAIQFASSKFTDIQFTAQDAPRADINFLKELIGVAIKNGAKTICLPDTAGFCLPQEYGELIKNIKEYIASDKILLAAHCHNDLGLAVANTISAIEAGAGQVECTINGIGERAGNTPMEEVAAIMNLKYKNSYSNNINLKYLKKTSAILESVINMKVHFNKPLFGRNVFLHSSGMHQKAIIENKETFEVINAEAFGIEGGKISIGKLSGSAGIKYFLDKLDISINDQELKKLVFLIKKESINIKEFDINSIKKIISNLNR